MLQQLWMRMIQSRKSTHNRQKQYFEQRKRQQQATRSENHADGNKGFNHSEGRSLDILSLHNLAAIAQQFCVDKDEDSVSKEKDRASESFLAFPSSRGAAGSSNIKELKKSPCFEKGSFLNIPTTTVLDSPGFPSGCCYSNEAHDKLDKRKIPSYSDPYSAGKNGAKEELFVLDLLSDDQSHSKSEGLPSGETHVAFFVKGLGKVWMETPVHSPGQVDSNVRSPTTVASRWMCSSQKLPDDLGLKLGATKDIYFLVRENSLDLGTANGICLSVGDSSLELVSDTRDMKNSLSNSDSFIFSGKGRKSLYSDAHQTYGNIFSVLDNIRSKMEATREDGFGMFEDVEDRKCDVLYDEKPFYMDLDVPNFSEIENSAPYDHGFEDTVFQNRRSAGKGWKMFGISDGPDTCFGHSTSMKDHDFVNFGSERCHEVDSSSHLKSKRPAWSFSMADDASDSLSLLSEESCSSTAVRNEWASNLGIDLLKLKQNNRKSKKVKNFEKRPGMETFASEVVDVDINEVLQEKNPVRTENNWSMPIKWAIKTKNCLEKSPAIEENSRAECISFSGEEHASVDTDLAPSLLYKPSTGTDAAAVVCKFKSEDCNFNLFMVPGVHMDTDASRRISTPGNHIKHVPYERIHLKKDILRQSLDHVACLTTFHLLEREDLPRDRSFGAESEQGKQFPHLTTFQKDCKDNKASDFQLTDCSKSVEKSQNKISIEKGTVTLGNVRTAVIEELRDHCSEHKKLKQEAPETSEPSEVRNVSTLSKVPLAMKNAPTTVQCISSQLLDRCRTNGSGLPSHQSYKKESRKENRKPANDNVESKGDSKVDASYQLMLENYVLQLLCVQKVLLESSEQENH